MRIDFLEAVEQIHMNYGVICGGEIAIIMKEGCLFSEPVSGRQRRRTFEDVCISYITLAGVKSKGSFYCILLYVLRQGCHYVINCTGNNRINFFSSLEALKRI